jgi:hypothetical protein
MRTGADVARFPAASVATAVSVCLPDGNGALTQVTVPAQLALVHGSVVAYWPLAYRSIFVTLTLSVAAMET